MKQIKIILQRQRQWTPDNAPEYKELESTYRIKSIEGEIEISTVRNDKRAGVGDSLTKQEAQGLLTIKSYAVKVVER